MKRDELSKHLNEYAKKVTTGAADTSHFNDIKNKIRQAYDAGNLDKEAMVELGKKASFNFKNMGKTPILQDLVPKILEKGGTVGKFEEAADPILGKVVKKAGKGLKSFGPLLGMLGAGAAAAGIGNKAMAGDLGGAGMDAADLATDYVPGLSQAKMALQSDELGKGSDVVGQQPSFDFSPYRTNKAVNDSKPNTANMEHFQNKPLENKPPRKKYADLQNMLSGIKK